MEKDGAQLGGCGEKVVTFPEIWLNYFRDRRDLAFTVQGGCGECSQKDKDLGDACSCYKVVEKENQLALEKKKESNLMSGAWSERKKAAFTFCIEVAVAPGAEEADSLFQPRSLAKVGARGPCAARLPSERFPGRGRSPATAP